MAPTYCKDCSKKISGFFKKKFTCHYCLGTYCDRCFSKVKANERTLSINLKEMTGQNCLTCVVFRCSQIKREHLFLLENKQLASYLTNRHIPTKQCSEKYHLVDLIMEFAETHGKKSRDDIENEVLHREHIESLRRKAETLRLQELNYSESNSRTEGSDRAGHSSENEAGGEAEQSQSSGNDSSTNDQYPNNTGTDDSNSSAGDNGRSTPIFDDTESPPDIDIDISPSNDVESSPDNERENSNSNDSDTLDSNEGSTSHTNGSRFVPLNDNSSGVEDDGNTRNSSPNNETLYPNAAESSKPSVSPRKQASGQWRSVEDIRMVEDIRHLSVLELKQILTANFIDYHGCCEKKELVDKVTMLYLQHHRSEDGGDPDDRDLCKICMDKTIDCIFLDCAHLVACTSCGKLLSECPICRALIVRVIHIFRA